MSEGEVGGVVVEKWWLRYMNNGIIPIIVWLFADGKEDRINELCDSGNRNLY